jgi:hypothetical protein
MGDIAFMFNFQPSELWEMDDHELIFWHKQAKRFVKVKGIDG